MATKKADFNLKSKDEEKQMISFTDALQDNLNNIVPNLKKLLTTLELYSKAEQQFANQISNTITSIDLISQTGMRDFDNGMYLLHEMFSELHNGRLNALNQATTPLIDAFKNELNKRTEELPRVIKQTKTERKKWDNDLAKSEKEVEKHPENMKELMGEFKRIEKERQQALMLHLQLTVSTNRSIFGNSVGYFSKFFKSQCDSSTNSFSKFISNEQKLNKLSKSVSNIPRELRNLMTNKKQSFVNLSGITPEIKQIMKEAGLKPHHIANKEIVTSFYLEIKKLVDAGKLPANILDQLKSTGNVDENIIASKKSSTSANTNNTPTKKQANTWKKTTVSKGEIKQSASKPSQSAPKPSQSAPKPSQSAPKPKQSAPRPSGSNARPSLSSSTQQQSNVLPPKTQPRASLAWNFSRPRGAQQDSQTKNNNNSTPQQAEVNDNKPEICQSTPKLNETSYSDLPPPPPIDSIVNDQTTQSNNILPPPPQNIPPPPTLNAPPPPSLNVPPPPPPALNAPPPPPVDNKLKQTSLVSNKPAEKKSNPPARVAEPSLLEQIKQGTKLKKTEDRPIERELDDQQKNDLTTLLSNVMANRRKDIADDEYDDDESEDWDDDD
ncbi:WH2 domain-containing protein [Entamoeba marina]